MLLIKKSKFITLIVMSHTLAKKLRGYLRNKVGLSENHIFSEILKIIKLNGRVLNDTGFN